MRKKKEKEQFKEWEEHINKLMGRKEDSSPTRRKKGKDDADKWIAIYDSSVGKNYYFDTDTCETTWDRPAELGGEETKPGEDPSANAKKERGSVHQSGASLPAELGTAPVRAGIWWASCKKLWREARFKLGDVLQLRILHKNAQRPHGREEGAPTGWELSGPPSSSAAERRPRPRSVGRRGP